MRLFVAMELSDVVRNRLRDLQASVGRTCTGVRWLAPEQLHLTVKFLGEVKDGDVAKVTGAVADGARNASAFSMRVAECGCFPPRGPVRIVWAGTHEPTGALLHSVRSICEPLERFGFPPETRDFSPHITIGRVREDHSGGKIRSAIAGGSLDPLEQMVQSVTLMSSVLSPKGPTYTPVSRAALGQGT